VHNSRGVSLRILVVDADYNFNKLNEPAIRLYGKIVGGVDEGLNIVLHVLGFEPYIIVGDCGLDIFELKKKVEEVARGFVKRVEIIKRFKPIGYQIEKSNMLRLVLFSPKVVQDLRKILKEGIIELTDSQLYEADIVFKNRFLVNHDISGMSVIEFNEVGKKINNYGLNCSNLYVCNKEDIKVLNEEIVIFDY